MRVGTVNMDFSYADYFGNEPATGYETLIYDCMNGDATLFKHADTVEKGWEIVQSVQDVWSALPARDFPNYAAGTWGPAAAGDLLKNDGRLWRRITTPDSHVGCAEHREARRRRRMLCFRSSAQPTGNYPEMDETLNR